MKMGADLAFKGKLWGNPNNIMEIFNKNIRKRDIHI